MVTESNKIISTNLSQNQQTIILDTDIGDDVDDAWALATVLSYPELDLIGVTTVYGDTSMRGSIALKLLHLAGKSDIPVAIGERSINAKTNPHKGKGILNFDGTDPSNFHSLSAKDFIIQMSHQYSGELLLVAIGPLSNIAQTIIEDPSIVDRLKGIVLMGGGFVSFNNRKEYNFACDPQAAETVLRSGIPLKVVGFNVTQHSRFSHKEFNQMTNFPDVPFVQALRSLTDIYMQKRINKILAKPVDQRTKENENMLKNPFTIIVNPNLDIIELHKFRINSRSNS